MLRLESVTKRYPGQAEPAVERLSLEVAAGELVVLVGPSGCGKTTTLRLINRLISPDEGWIYLDGSDVAAADPDELRRGIGYVIQQIGLFPHLTVAENVATVPRMLGWPQPRIDARTDELLATLGLEPATYRDRHPRELSGGQQQRVGVARAMAADPPVLLMDEPFGSLDRVTRTRLQDELLRLQSEMGRTILFVTHDIDEAIRLGDRIAMVDRGARLVQYDVPARVLTEPAEPFAAEFVGAGATLRGLVLVGVDDAGRAPWPVLPRTTERARVREAIVESGALGALLVDEAGRPRRWVTVRDLERVTEPGAEPGVPAAEAVRADASLHEALDAILGSPLGAAAVVDPGGACVGVLDLEAVSAAVRSARRSAEDRTERRPEAVTG